MFRTIQKSSRIFRSVGQFMEPNFNDSFQNWTTFLVSPRRTPSTWTTGASSFKTSRRKCLFRLARVASSHAVPRNRLRQMRWVLRRLDSEYVARTNRSEFFSGGIIYWDNLTLHKFGRIWNSSFGGKIGSTENLGWLQNCCPWPRVQVCAWRSSTV